MASNPTCLRNAKIEKAKRLAQRDLLAFLKWCWWMPHKLIVGRHTQEICARITRAVDDWLEGKSTYLLIAVPFRHGKSDMISRALPAWFLGHCAAYQPDIIMSGYGGDLVRGFSRQVKRILDSPRYQMLFPGIYAAQKSNRAESWHVENSAGTITAQGLGGSLTGKGGHLLIVDDYCKNRVEAVSKVFRDRVWDSFRNDLMTRQNAPASIVIVCATPWHVDDVRGRIKREMEADDDFPQFEELKYPARNHGLWDYLFPERFSASWYDSQRSTLGKQAPALLDCEPLFEGGERFATDRIVYHHTLDNWPQGREIRGWDLASSSRERNSDDPDYTAGVRGHTRRVHTGVHGVYRHEIWIKSIVATRSEAPARDALIRATAAQDGAGVVQHIEAFGGYKDAYTTLKTALNGVCVVRPSRLPGDKSAKLAALEPSFEAGDVHVYVPGVGNWLDTWLSQFAAFPNGAHDDFCDATAVMFHEQVHSAFGGTMLI